MADLVASIRECAADRLAGFMSMHDLAVTATPIRDTTPIDVIWVRPQPADNTDSQDVLIEHWAATGWDGRYGLCNDRATRTDGGVESNFVV